MAGPDTPLAELTVSDVMRSDFESISPDVACSKVLAFFADEAAPAVVLTDEKGRYEGFVSERDVIRKHLDYAKTPISHVVPNHATPALKPDDLLLDAASSILDSNSRGVAVVDKDEKVQGILVREDIIHEAGIRELGKEPLADYMTDDVELADADESVAKGLSRMRNGGFSHLPVIDDGRLVGIVTYHDVIRRFLAPMVGPEGEGWKTGERERPLSVPLSTIMTSPITNVPRGSTYSDAAELIHEKGIGSVVVTKDGEFPVGIVTRRDLLGPIAVMRQEVPTLVVHFSSKDTSREGYETSGSPEEVRSFLQRYQSKLEPGLLQIHAKRHKDKNRGLDLWLVRLNLSSDLGKFYAVGEGWGMAHATRLAVDRLEREVRRAKEELEDYPSREFIEDMMY